MKYLLFISICILFGLTGCHPSNKDGQNNSNQSKQLPDSNSAVISAEPGVFFKNLKYGDTLKSPVIIQMGVVGMQVEPAGQIHAKKGHHHIIIDGSFVEAGKTIPSDKTHLHFGKGQTTDTLFLSPGIHTLTLQFANGLHESYGKVWSRTIMLHIIK
jgi:hypothetical protein